MPAVSLTTADLAPFAEIPPAKAQAMIDDAMALAELVAPCLSGDELSEQKGKAVKAILRAAILRWHDSGSGAVSQQVVGPWQQTLDNRQPRRSLFWPSEIDQLQKICQSDDDASVGAWSYDTVGLGSVHADTCSINFGANYCSCGAIYAGVPLWETTE